LKLCTLASGSSGNAIFVTSGDTSILIDAGISAKRISTGLTQIGYSAKQLDAICITHSHSDHISGLRVFLKQCTCPVYATRMTADVICEKVPDAESRIRLIDSASRFQVGEINITSFSTPHDAPGSVGFSFTDGTRKCSIVTDLGYVTDEVKGNILGSHLALVEANHDPEWVRTGPYPYPLKERVLGDHGHLSNESCGALCCDLVRSGAQTLILGHLSKENNHPSLAKKTVCAALSQAGFENVTVVVADRQECGPLMEV
jgi:phosphoribosyl 1,2-cyclic phosphodiesterase